MAIGAIDYRSGLFDNELRKSNIDIFTKNNKIYRMKTWIAFLKGINVGGHNILPMKDLRSIGDALGHKNFSTYIQSGNCAFQSDKSDAQILASDLSIAVAQSFSFSPPVLVVSMKDIKRAIAANPFEVEIKDSNKVHFHFLWSDETQFDEDEANRIATQDEKFEFIGSVLYLHAPEGVGRSKLYAKLPRLLTEDMTVRNLKTVSKIYDMGRCFKDS